MKTSELKDWIRVSIEKDRVDGKSSMRGLKQHSALWRTQPDDGLSLDQLPSITS